MEKYIWKRYLPKHNSFLIISILLVLLITSGCASYGKLSRIPTDETDTLLADILSQTDHYTIHYHGNSEKIVSGILFDPKADTNSIIPEGVYWKETLNAETIAAIVDTIQSAKFPYYFPNLYQINDPNGAFFGYIFTGWNALTIRPVDEHTVRVYGLKGPPEYENVRPGGI
jgi:hypothetical protein